MSQSLNSSLSSQSKYWNHFSNLFLFCAREFSKAAKVTTHHQQWPTPPTPRRSVHQRHPAPPDLLQPREREHGPGRPTRSTDWPLNGWSSSWQTRNCAMIFLCQKSNQRSQPLVEEGWPKACVPYNISKHLLPTTTIYSQS